MQLAALRSPWSLPGSTPAEAGSGQGCAKHPFPTRCAPTPAPRLAEARERLAAEYEQRCAAYAAAKGGTEERTTARQEEVRAVVEAAAARPEGERREQVAFLAPERASVQLRRAS